MAERILIVDDHKILRDGLRTLLEQQSGLQVVGEAADGLAAIQAAADLKPDLIVMDIAMPGLNGIEASRRILRDNPVIRIIALSMYADRKFVQECLKAGVKGYLLKESAFEELHLAIGRVMQDQLYLGSAITSLVVRDFITHESSLKQGSVFQILTPREREILQLLAEGQTTKAMAGKLGISAKTVETFRKQIMEKLDLHSVAELTKFAIREGLTTL